MQQRPNNRAANSVRTRRSRDTKSVLPRDVSSASVSSAADAGQKPYRVRLCVSFFVLLGILVEVLYLALYPLLMKKEGVTDPVWSALVRLFPTWLPRFHWSMVVPTMLLANVPWLAPATVQGRANLFLLFSGLAMLFSLCAALMGRRVSLPLCSPRQVRVLFWTLFLFTCLFALTMVLAPAGPNWMSQSMLLSGLYGRMVVVYHVNPYAFALATFRLDPLQVLNASISGGSAQVSAASAGPVWMDVCILVTLAAHNSIARVLMSFRLVAAVAHLGSVVLIWTILAKVKPQMRIFATLLYAWNPLVLLLGISQVHLEVVLVLFVLLAIHFFQRDSLTLSWVFVLLASLVNLSCLLLLPLFFRVMVRRIRFMRWGWRLAWWLGLVLVSALVVVLAYAPYWSGWGGSGLVESLRQIFWQDSAINSLDAAVLKLPVHLPAIVLWVFTPHHWTGFMLLVLGIFLLFVLWPGDTLELALLCASVLLLLFVLLQPMYWPWYSLVPLALALCSGNRNVILLAVLLLPGALLSTYFWQWSSVWPGQGLASVGIPCLLWGWVIFLRSTWQRARANEAPPVVESRPLRLVRPPWLSRPVWPSRPGRRRSL